MSGHSKWSSIKHKKAIVDAKRGNVFTKIIREITVAARMGGGDPDANATLRHLIVKAKAANMPADNITRAIKKGTGDLEGVHYEEQQFEAYGPSGIALIIRVLTDNKNRSSAEIKSILGKRGGSLATQGAVSYLFKRKGQFEIALDKIPEDDLFLLVTEAGADDMKKEKGHYSVLSSVEDYETVRECIEKAGIEMAHSELGFVADTLISITELSEAQKLFKLTEALEENDDVQAVFDNADISESVLSQMEEA